MEYQAGDVVGDYRIAGLLGAGGMGRVYRVRNLISDREEALKVVRPESAGDPGSGDRFLQEIRLHASLDHPNIAGLRTAFRAGDEILMVIELVAGPSLEQELRHGPLGVGEAIACTAQVLAALEYAHGRGVVHRDIKPANILLSAGGTVKLTDFGIARSAGGRKLTITGMALGSLLYMAPEQIQAREVDGRADLYSLGITLYEMLTGRHAIEGGNEYAIMNAHLSQMPVPPEQWSPSVPAELSAIVLKALAKNPAERIQSAGEFQEALRRLGLPVPAISVRADPQAAPGGIPAEELFRIESRLMRVLGPIARHLVSKAAREVRDVAELCQELAGQIADPREREAFLKSCRAGVTTRPPTGSTARTTASASAAAWDRDWLDALGRKLSPYVGPIAPVIVARAARRAATRDELYSLLAAEIPSERERSEFLAAAR